ncbi:MAG: DNA-directed RNA polymerase subunit A', partial [Candidatus Aenigmarchaeota archaeon]|nr:DNA-directed RNA polymerase subunit A' [Candidatus Aenigmarchaeota archaeon]
HFKKDVLEPKAHGFVTSSLKDGLDPVEFFFEVMKGREGIMDSSLKTRVSGYMQRRLVNALQDIMLDKDMIVKDGEGTVVQFVPGEDGIDPAKSDRGSLDSNIKF